MKEYEYLDDLTSDVAFNAYGKTLKDVFVNSAKAISNIMFNSEKISSKNKIIIEVEGKDEKDLLYNWLQNIVAEVDIQGMFFSKFDILEITSTKLKAEVYGDDIDQSIQETVVKAITNYLFDLKKIEDDNGESIYQATACVDI